MEASALLNFANIIGASTDQLLAEVTAIVSGFAAVGLLASAIIEVIKVFFNPRQLLYRFYFQTHIAKTLTRRGVPYGFRVAAEIEQDLADLISGGEVSLIYRRDFSQIVVQVKTALNNILNYPTHRGIRILASISRGNEKQIIADWLWFAEVSRAEELEKTHRDQLSTTKSMILSRAEGYLNGLQLLVDSRWQMLVRVMAMAISFLLIMSYGEFTVDWVLLAFAGGLFSPFAHDVLKKLKPVK